ncbi:MAG: polyamine aminopropyltransferase [Chloroflexi bacterium]|nr:polyamine aminopropyltransferase [Chloroflexota bacterium]
MEIDPNKWFYDQVSLALVQLHSIEEVLYKGQTKFQSVEIFRSGILGKVLVLDGKVQSAEADEFIYHEALVQPPMITHRHPETVFIAGGGEGATLREVLRHKTVKRAVMVDLDEEVVRLCQKYLPDHSQGAFQDRRAEVYHTDARDYLAKSKDKYDVIILDVPDPVEEGPAYLLYTQEFYRLVLGKLTDCGIVSVQAGPAGWTDLLNFSSVFNTLRSVFPIVRAYKADVPSFGSPWGFCLASLSDCPLQLSVAEIDRRIASRGLTLKSYDGVAHQGMFALPKYLRTELTAQTRLITDSQPLYIYATER